MNDLSCPQESDGIGDFRIFHQAKDIVVGGAGFLFSGQILMQIRDRIALGLELCRGKRYAARCLGPDTHGVIYIVRGETVLLNFFRG